MQTSSVVVMCTSELLKNFSIKNYMFMFDWTIVIAMVLSVL